MCCSVLQCVAVVCSALRALGTVTDLNSLSSSLVVWCLWPVHPLVGCPGNLKKSFFLSFFLSVFLSQVVMLIYTDTQTQGQFQCLVTPASLGYPLSVFNKTSTLTRLGDIGGRGRKMVGVGGTHWDTPSKTAIRSVWRQKHTRRHTPRARAETDKDTHTHTRVRTNAHTLSHTHSLFHTHTHTHKPTYTADICIYIHVQIRICALRLRFQVNRRTHSQRLHFTSHWLTRRAAAHRMLHAASEAHPQCTRIVNLWLCIHTRVRIWRVLDMIVEIRMWKLYTYGWSTASG